MGSLWLIEELCGVCADMSRIIQSQAVALEQLGAVCMEDERAAVERRLTILIGRDEAPDLYKGGKAV